MGVERHATHPIAAHKHQVRTKLSQKAFVSKGWDVPVPGQGAEAMLPRARDLCDALGAPWYCKCCTGRPWLLQ